MTQVYALVNNGQVIEIIRDDRDINELFHPDFVKMLVDVTGLAETPQEGWTAVMSGSNWTFAAPVPYVPTPDELKARNTTTRDALLQIATSAIAPLQYAVDLDMATEDEVETLNKWKLYGVQVNRMDLTLSDPVWPTEPA